MIEADRVSFSYTEAAMEAGRAALRDVSLRIGEGEYVALLGPNGSGKSTLARLLNGLLQPSAGTVAVDGISTADAKRLPEVRRRVQLVFQQPESQLVGLTLEEDVAFGLAGIGTPHAEMAARVEQALGLVGLGGRGKQPVYELSGGEMQRLALASTLVLEPRCLVLDEATAMLDPAASDALLLTVHRLRRERGFALVQITHHVEEALGADRIVLFRSGKIVAEGTPEEVLGQGELLNACGLELPYAAELARRLREQTPEGWDLPVLPTDEDIVRAVCGLN